MKTLFYLCSVLALLLVGCGQKEKQPALAPATSTPAAEAPAAPASGNLITAPVDYLAAVGQGKVRAEKTIDTVALNQAIQMFNVQEDRYPKDLSELVTKKYLRVLPEPPYGTQIVYDPNTGTVKVVKK